MSLTNTIPREHRDLQDQLQDDVERFLRAGGKIERVIVGHCSGSGHFPDGQRMMQQSRRNSLRQRLLTMDQAREIRRRYNGTRGCIKNLAKDYRVSIDVISSILNGRSYLERG